MHLVGCGPDPDHMSCHTKVYEIVVGLAKFYGLNAEDGKFEWTKPFVIRLQKIFG
jgi:hypothetical protein